MDPNPNPYPDGLLMLSLVDPGMKIQKGGTNVIKLNGLVGLILERLPSVLFCMVWPLFCLHFPAVCLHIYDLGSGRASLDFGNCWNRGQVSAYLNDEKIATAGESTEATVEFAFHEGFVLKIVEHDTSIIQFNGFSVTECSGKCLFTKRFVAKFSMSLSCIFFLIQKIPSMLLNTMLTMLEMISMTEKIFHDP